MSDREIGFEAFNAKKLSPGEVARTFVVPETFRAIAGADHSYLIGPRGSGKTTLLRMLTSESLDAWQGPRAESYKAQIDFWSIFLPADQLWSQQTSDRHAKALFALQALYAFTQSISYLLNGSGPAAIRKLSPTDERLLVEDLCEGWAIKPRVHTLLGLAQEVDRLLIAVGRDEDFALQVGDNTALGLMDFTVRTFNRFTSNEGRRWAILIDEMELAPRVIHDEVSGYVRGGGGDLLVKVSMSPFDRFIDSDSSSGVPVPGHDFRVVHLSGQGRQDVERITRGLWEEALKARGLPAVRMEEALGDSSYSYGYRGRSGRGTVQAVLERAYRDDQDFAKWVRRKHLNLGRLDDLSYETYSATVRKVYPLLVFRESLARFAGGRVAGRKSGKRSASAFVGATAVTTALEGNPRWIKIAFSEMIDHWDIRRSEVSDGYQLGALVSLSSRFEALLRVLPRPESMARSMSVMELVDSVARYMSQANLGPFQADPPNVFTIDHGAPPPVLDAIITGLYAGALVHVRDKQSPDVLDRFGGQRFRLAYVFGVRAGREFPLRLGKDVKLSSIVTPTRDAEPDRPTFLDFDWG